MFAEWVKNKKSCLFIKMWWNNNNLFSLPVFASLSLLNVLFPLYQLGPPTWLLNGLAIHIIKTEQTEKKWSIWNWSDMFTLHHTDCFLWLIFDTVSLWRSVFSFELACKTDLKIKHRILWTDFKKWYIHFGFSTETNLFIYGQIRAI